MRYQRGRATGPQAERAAATLRRRLEAGAGDRKTLIEGMDATRFNGAQLWLDILRVPPGGTWERRRADVYALAEERLGPPPAIEAGAAAELLVRRYLQGFGPGAPEGDRGLGRACRRARSSELLEGMELRRFRTEAGGLLVDLPRLALPGADSVAPPRFLPTWDATLLAHARRTQILPEEHRAKVFGVKTPQSTETFTVDGQVAGHLEVGRRTG